MKRKEIRRLMLLINLANRLKQVGEDHSASMALQIVSNALLHAATHKETSDDKSTSANP